VLCSESRGLRSGVAQGSEGVASHGGAPLDCSEPGSSGRQPDDPRVSLGLQAGGFSEASDIAVLSPGLLQKPLGEDGCDGGSPPSPPTLGSPGDGRGAAMDSVVPGLDSPVLYCTR